MKDLQLFFLKSATALVTVVTISVLSTAPSYSRVPNCGSVIEKTDIALGAVCIEKVKIQTGKADWPDGYQESELIEHTPPTKEWLIMDYSEPIGVSVNNGRIKDFNPVYHKNNSDIRSKLESEDREIHQFKDHLLQELKDVSIKDIPATIKDRMKKLRELEEENHKMYELYSHAASNVSKIVVVASANGICTAEPDGDCVDGERGWYDGYVEVTQVYVGDVDAHLDNTSEQIRNIKIDIDKWQACAQETQSSDCKLNNGSKNSSVKYFLNPRHWIRIIKALIKTL